MTCGEWRARVVRRAWRTGAGRGERAPPRRGDQYGVRRLRHLEEKHVGDPGDARHEEGNVGRVVGVGEPFQDERKANR